MMQNIRCIKYCNNILNFIFLPTRLYRLVAQYGPMDHKIFLNSPIGEDIHILTVVMIISTVWSRPNTKY